MNARTIRQARNRRAQDRRAAFKALCDSIDGDVWLYLGGDGNHVGAIIANLRKLGFEIVKIRKGQHGSAP